MSVCLCVCVSVYMFYVYVYVSMCVCVCVCGMWHLNGVVEDAALGKEDRRLTLGHLVKACGLEKKGRVSF